MRSLSLPQDRTCYLYENKVPNSGTPRDGSKPMVSPMKLVSSTCRRAVISHHLYGRAVTHILWCFLKMFYSLLNCILVDNSFYDPFLRIVDTCIMIIIVLITLCEVQC